MQPRDYYAKQARDLLRQAKEDRQITHAQLATMLKEHGEHIETQALINKINRGTYSLRFVFQCLAAMGVKTINVPNFVEHELKLKKDAVDMRESYLKWMAKRER